MSTRSTKIVAMVTYMLTPGWFTTESKDYVFTFA